MSGGESGAASLAVFSLLVLCAALTAGGALLLDASFAVEKRGARAGRDTRELDVEARRVVALLADDPTPDADSPTDPVWAELDAPLAAGAIVGLKDVSSALNPNWAQKAVFTKTVLKSLLRDEACADALQQRRQDRGFATDLVAAYGDLFAEGALAAYCTCYGYANVNTTDEFALRSLYALRTDDPAGAEAFHVAVQGLLAQRKLLGRDDMRVLFGPAYDMLSPVMNVEPGMNVHFIDPRVLAALLAYPDLEVPDPSGAALEILGAREAGELSQKDLRRMIGAPETSRIYAYLGVVTWFWKVSVAREGLRHELIVARVPGEPGAPVRFAIVEERTER
jgi:hypothetical protein